MEQQLNVRYLQTILTDAQIDLVAVAAERGLPIIIDGQPGPTGKSTLAGYLKSIGCYVTEGYELFEARVPYESKRKKKVTEANTLQLLITLDRQLERLDTGLLKSFSA